MLLPCSLRIRSTNTQLMTFSSVQFYILPFFLEADFANTFQTVWCSTHIKMVQKYAAAGILLIDSLLMSIATNVKWLYVCV